MITNPTETTAALEWSLWRKIIFRFFAIYLLLQEANR